MSQQNITIPDLEKLTNNVLDFIEFINKPETIKLKAESTGNYNYIINEKFADLPLSMIKLLSDTENRAKNLEKVLDMITMLRSVKNGQKSFGDAENEFMEKRSEEYLYPAFGGRDNFYRIAEENKKKK
jgi:hypothetical protein